VLAASFGIFRRKEGATRSILIGTKKQSKEKKLFLGGFKRPNRRKQEARK